MTLFSEVLTTIKPKKTNPANGLRDGTGKSLIANPQGGRGERWIRDTDTTTKRWSDH